MKRLTALGIVAFAVLAALPAAAHEEIAPASIPVGKAAFLTLSAANEKQTAMVGLKLAAPKGATFGDGVREPAGWKGNVTGDTVSWDGGTLDPGHFDQWGVELEAVDQPGTLTFTFTLRFADGSTEDSEVPLTVTAPGAPSVTSAPPTTAGSTGPTATSLGTTPTAGAKDNGRANLALGIAIAAIALAGAGLATGLRGWPGASGDTIKSTGPEQPW